MQLNRFDHIALCKVGSTYGLYHNGVQKSYVSDSFVRNFSASLLVGGRATNSFFEGHIDELRIQHSNIFSASPNSGNTDTITVPTEPYTNEAKNMTLVSESQSAESEPDSARLVVFEEDVDAVTLNTDLKAYISKDDGSTWAEGTLENEGKFEGDKKVLTSFVDLSVSGIGSGTDMVYKLETKNGKNLKIHGTSLLWD